jgi:hypothetical protein
MYLHDILKRLKQRTVMMYIVHILSFYSWRNSLYRYLHSNRNRNWYWYWNDRNRNWTNRYRYQNDGNRRHTCFWTNRYQYRNDKVRKGKELK